jgi:hypothetical protein
VAVVRPGGRLAITTWGPDFFQPATAAFWSSVRDERPDLYRGFNPWDRITDPRASACAMRIWTTSASPVFATWRRM